MSTPRSIAIFALVLVLLLAAGACIPAPGAPATATPAKVAGSPTTAPPAPTPTVPPTPTPSPTPTPAPVTAGDLNNKAKAVTEYSFTNRITAGTQVINSKGFAKGNKMRFEMTVAGQNTVILMDSGTKEAFALFGQNTAFKIDFSQAQSQTEQPNAGMAGVANDAKPVRTETVDGKSASVFEGKTDQGPVTYWIWTERGLPLKAEVPSSQGKVTVEYLDYQLASQPDNLFQLPPGTQILDLPAQLPGNLPNLPGLPPARS